MSVRAQRLSTFRPSAAAVSVIQFLKPPTLKRGLQWRKRCHSIAGTSSCRVPHRREKFPAARLTSRDSETTETTKYIHRSAVKLLKVMMATKSGLEECDAIEHEGKLWLVPEWLDYLEQGIAKPARIVRFDLLAHQKTSLPGCDYVLNFQVPRDVLEGRSRSEGGISFEVVEAPDIQVRIPPSAMH